MKANLLELIRSRIYLTALGLVVALVLLSALLNQMSGGEEGRVVTDVGLWVGSILVDVLAVVLALASALRLGTVEALLVLTRPVSRGTVVMARFAAVVVVVAVAALTCGLALAGVATLAESKAVHLIPGATVMIAVEGSLAAAIAMTAGVAMSSAAAAMTSVLILVVGRLGDLLLELTEAGRFGGAAPILKIVVRVMPQLWRFDTARWLISPSLSGLAVDVAYGVVASVGLLALSVVLFNRRPLG